LAIYSYGQKATLIENVNYRAKELKQTLSKNGDSLILQGEREIYKVEIYNSDFDKEISVNDSRVEIPLRDLPVGRYVVDATLIDKHIIMTLFKNEDTEEIYEPTQQSDDLGAKKRQPFIDRHAQLLSKPSIQISPNLEKYYWVMHKVNNGSASQKKMRLENKDVVDKIILKHDLELKTLKGKHNTLTIWEIYDRKAFIKKQISNPSYINSLSSEFFNVLPYYTSENSVQ
jgi:hypothetical protein